MLGDNCSVNIKIASLLQKPHVGCKNHKLALEVNKYMESEDELHNGIESIHTMKKIKGSTKNCAALCGMTRFKPVLFIKTGWSGKYHVLARLLKIHDHLVALAEDVAESDFRMEINCEIT